MKGTGTFTFSDGSTYVGEWESLGDTPKIKSGTGTFTSGPESYEGESEEGWRKSEEGWREERAA